MKVAEVEFVTASAMGDKGYECTTQKGMFKRLQAGDLFALLTKGSGCKVGAVGEVANAAIFQETRRSTLFAHTPKPLHEMLKTYLGGATHFDYVQFIRVFDVRHLDITCVELLAKGHFEDPRQPWNGMLAAKATSFSRICKLRDYLLTHALVRDSDDGIDIF